MPEAKVHSSRHVDSRSKYFDYLAVIWYIITLWHTTGLFSVLYVEHFWISCQVCSPQQANKITSINVGIVHFYKQWICWNLTFLYDLRFCRFIFCFMLWQSSAYGRVRFRHKKHTVRVGKYCVFAWNTCICLHKHMDLSPLVRLEIVLRFLKMIWWFQDLRTRDNWPDVCPVSAALVIKETWSFWVISYLISSTWSF